MHYTVIDLQNDSLPSTYELYKIEYNGDSDNERKSWFWLDFPNLLLFHYLRSK